MAKVLAFANQKGGVGKTISSVNLAYGLATKKNKKVLLIDLDLQANSCRKFLEENENIDGINEVLSGKIGLKDVIYPTSVSKNLFVIPSKMELEDTVDKLGKNFAVNPVTLLRKHLKEVKKDFDYIILDNNPNSNLLIVNSIYCSDAIIVPVNIDNNAIKGVDYTISKIRKTIDQEDEIPLNVKLYILMTMVTHSAGKPTRNAQEIDKQLRDIYGEAVLKTSIHKQDKPAQDNTDKNNYFVVDHASTTIGNDYLTLMEEIEGRMI